MSVFDTPSFTASMVLLTMGFVSLAISLSLRLKSRALGSSEENTQIGIFKRTFNVFNPYPARRKVIHGNLRLLIFIAIYGSFVGIGFAIMKIFEFGFLLAFFTLVICLGFLLIDETLEIHKNAGIFVNAFRKHTPFGEGDLEALNFLKRTLPRLSNYHLMIAVAFFATSLAVPSVANVFLLSFSGLASFIFTVSAALWFFPPLVLLCTALMFGATIFAVQFAANKVKTRILSFPSPERLDVLSEQSRRMKQFVGIQHHHPTLHMPDVEHRKEDESEVESNKS